MKTHLAVLAAAVPDKRKTLCQCTRGTTIMSACGVPGATIYGAPGPEPTSFWVTRPHLQHQHLQHPRGTFSTSTSSTRPHLQHQHL